MVIILWTSVLLQRWSRRKWTHPSAQPFFGGKWANRRQRLIFLMRYRVQQKICKHPGMGERRKRNDVANGEKSGKTKGIWLVARIKTIKRTAAQEDSRWIFFEGRSWGRGFSKRGRKKYDRFFFFLFFYPAAALVGPSYFIFCTAIENEKKGLNGGSSRNFTTTEKGPSQLATGIR